MKFGNQFEFHKIPEWYEEYLDFNSLQTLLASLKAAISCKTRRFIMQPARPRNSRACTL